MIKKEREAILRGALEDALEGLNEMLPYVPDFVVRKHSLVGYVERALDALEATRDQAGDKEEDEKDE